MSEELEPTQETFEKADVELRKVLEDLKTALDGGDLEEAKKLVSGALGMLSESEEYPGAEKFVESLESLSKALGADDDDLVWERWYVLESLALPKADREELKEKQTKRASACGIEPKKGGNLTRPSSYSDVPDTNESWGDWSNYRYPLVPAARAVNAVTRFNDSANRAAGGYDMEEWDRMGRRIAKKNGEDYTYDDERHIVVAPTRRAEEEAEEKGDSLNEKLKRIEESFHHKFQRALAQYPEGRELWIHETYEDHVIASMGGEYFKIPYQEQDGEIVFGDPVEVEKETIYSEKGLRETLFHLEFKEVTTSEDDQWLYVEGYASTDVTDRVGDRIFPNAFTQGLKAYLQNPVLLLYHDLRKPIGKVIEAKIDGAGLWVKAGIDKTLEWGKKAANMIGKGILNAFSVRAVDDLAEGFVDATGIRNITNWDLREISAVTVPANQQALFSIAKALEVGTDLIEKEADNKLIVGGKEMGEEITVEELTAKIKEQLKAEAKAEAEREEEEQKKIEAIEKAAIEKYQQELMDKAKRGEELPFEHAVEEEPKRKPIFVASKFDRVPTGDLALGYMVLKANGVTPSTEMFRCLVERAGKLFTEGKIDWQMAAPSPEDPGSYRVGYKQLMDVAPRADEYVHTTQTGYGEEWIPTLASAELWREIRLEAKVLNLFPQFDMPSQPYDYPVESTDPTFYKVGETTDEGMLAFGASHPVPDSKIATAEVQFSAGKLGARTHWSTEMDEDSIIAVQPQFRDQFGIKLAHVMDEVVLSGDQAGTATNTNISYYGAAEGTTRVLLTIDGLRHEPLVTTTTDSFSAGVLTLEDFVTARSKMGTAGKYAVDPSQLVYIMDPGVWFKAVQMDEVLTRDQMGDQATLLTGQLGGVFSIPIVVSEDYNLTNTNGYIHSNTVNNTKGSFLCVNLRGWKVGWRRRPRVFIKAYPEFDSSLVLALVRFDIRPMKIGMCSVGYNVTI